MVGQNDDPELAADIGISSMLDPTQTFIYDKQPLQLH